MRLSFFYRGYDVMNVDEETIRERRDAETQSTSCAKALFSKSALVGELWGARGIFSYFPFLSWPF